MSDQTESNPVPAADTTAAAPAEAPASDSAPAVAAVSSVPSADLDPSGSGLSVLVTGGTGFIAGWIIVLLLQRGYKVRTTVRNPEDAKTKEILGILQNKAQEEEKQCQSIQAVAADLLGTSHEDWTAAVSGCDYVIHCASPFFVEKAKDEEKEFFKPAKEGTINVLKAVVQAGGVKRVVITSSVAAVAYGQVESKGAVKKVYTESDWSNPDRTDGYIKSKLIAEKAAWEFLEKLEDQSKKFELVSINPTFVQGNLLHEKAAASQVLVQRILDGVDPMLPEAGFNFVDVYDVALAHIRAMRVPQAAGQRYIVNACNPEKVVTMLDAARLLAAEYNPKGFSVATRRAPYWVLKCMSWFDSSLRIVLEDVKSPKAVDGSKATRELGIHYILWSDSIKAMAESCIKFKLLKKMPKNLK